MFDHTFAFAFTFVFTFAFTITFAFAFELVLAFAFTFPFTFVGRRRRVGSVASMACLPSHHPPHENLPIPTASGRVGKNQHII